MKSDRMDTMDHLELLKNHLSKVPRQSIGESERSMSDSSLSKIDILKDDV